jgi:hypothetical protein
MTADSPFPSSSIRAAWASGTGKLHAALALFFCLLLPGASYFREGRIFAWNMFSKSETYRITIDATYPDGAHRDLDPRILGRVTNRELAMFLPPPHTWQHDPVSLGFRTGLPSIAALACRASHGSQHDDVVLEERADLDAPIRATEAHTECR